MLVVLATHTSVCNALTSGCVNISSNSVIDFLERERIEFFLNKKSTFFFIDLRYL